MRTSRIELVAVTACSTLLLGCPPTTVYRTAEPLARGETRVGAGAALGVYRDREQDTRIPGGLFELGVRRGVGGNVDLGARLVPIGLDVFATARFLGRGGWSLAIAPQLTGLRTPRTVATTNAVYLLGGAAGIATYRFSPSWALSFGPSLGGGLYWPETGGNAGGLWIGTFLNVEWRLSERWFLVPELAAQNVVSGEIPVRGAFLHAGLGLALRL
jgi:hypothetical protein